MLPSQRADIILLGESPPQKVLVIDDEPAIRAVFAEILQHPGVEVQCAASAEVALERLRTGAFDLAIVDKNLPEMSGLSFMRVVRDARMDTDFIVVTGFASLDSAVEALRMGAIDYLHKPFKDLEQIKLKVLAALERRRLARVNPGRNEPGRDGPRDLDAANRSLADAEHRMKIDALWVENSELKGAIDRLLTFMKDAEARLTRLAGPGDVAERAKALAQVRQELRAHIESVEARRPSTR